MSFVGNILYHIFAIILARAMIKIISLIVALFVVTQCAAFLWAQEPGDFMYQTDLEIVNSSVATSTRMIPVPVNLQNYVNSGLIRSDGTDRIFTFANNATTSGFVQDMTINGANVWVFATSGPSTTIIQKMFHGGSDADQGFPLVGANNDGIGSAVGGHSPLRATSTASIEISDLLDVRVDISAHVPCGTIVWKVGNNIENPTGYGLWSVGPISVSTVITAGGAGGNTALYVRATPLNFDLWICSVGSIQTFTDWVKATSRSVEIYDVDSGDQICLSDTVIPITATGLVAGSQQQMMLNTPCFVRQDQEVRIIVNGLDMGDSTTAITSTSTDGNILFETSGGSEGAEPWRANGTASLNITYIRDTLIGTSTGARIGAMVDDTWQFGLSSADWHGQRSTLAIDYNDPDFDVLIDSVVEYTITEAGGIATSTGDLEIGRGFDHGTIYNYEMDAGVSTVVDVDFDGDDITQSHVGNSANAFQWLGDIANEGTASATDLEYVLTFNDTNINTSVSGFQENPTPTPIGGGVSTSTAIIGSPSFNPFFTPVPTPPTGIITVPLKDAASASSLPTDLWWMILGAPLLAVVLGLFYKFFPNKPIMAGIAVAGFAIISMASGGQFGMVWVAMFGLWAFGSTGLILWGSR